MFYRSFRLIWADNTTNSTNSPFKTIQEMNGMNSCLRYPDSKTWIFLRLSGIRMS